jgi:hypothetical protein
MNRRSLLQVGLTVVALGLGAACASAGSHLVGTVAAVAPQTQTLVVRGNAGEETTVRVTEDTHFWSGRSLDQIQTGDRVSLTVERQGDVVTARSIEIFPAGRPRTRWIGPGGY